MTTSGAKVRAALPSAPSGPRAETAGVFASRENFFHGLDCVAGAFDLYADANVPPDNSIVDKFLVEALHSSACPNGPSSKDLHLQVGPATKSIFNLSDNSCTASPGCKVDCRFASNKSCARVGHKTVSDKSRTGPGCEIRNARWMGVEAKEVPEGSTRSQASCCLEAPRRRSTWPRNSSYQGVGRQESPSSSRAPTRRRQ